jgi:hypothetical protein
MIFTSEAGRDGAQVHQRFLIGFSRSGKPHFAADKRKSSGGSSLNLTLTLRRIGKSRLFAVRQDKPAMEMHTPRF